MKKSTSAGPGGRSGDSSLPSISVTLSVPARACNAKAVVTISPLIPSFQDIPTSEGVSVWICKDYAARCYTTEVWPTYGNRTRGRARNPRSTASPPPIEHLAKDAHLGEDQRRGLPLPDCAQYSYRGPDHPMVAGPVLGQTENSGGSGQGVAPGRWQGLR